MISHPKGPCIQDVSPVRKRGVILILRRLETGVKEEIHTVYHAPFTKNIKPSFVGVCVHRYLIYFPSKLQNSIVKKLGNQNTFAKLPKMLLYSIWSLLAIRYFNDVWYTTLTTFANAFAKCKLQMAFSNPYDAEAENYYHVKSARIRSYFGPHFPAFRLNTERYEVSPRMQSKCGKIRTKISPNTDTFQTVYETAGEVSHWKFKSFI